LKDGYVQNLIIVKVWKQNQEPSRQIPQKLAARLGLALLKR